MIGNLVALENNRHFKQTCSKVQNRIFTQN